MSTFFSASGWTTLRTYQPVNRNAGFMSTTLAIRSRSGVLMAKCVSLPCQFHYWKIPRIFELTSVQGHPRSMILIPIESIYEFLLVIHSNLSPILHRFWDTATYWLKIAYFSYPSLIRRPRAPIPMFPLEFRGKVKRQETRVMGLLCSEGYMILTSSVFDVFDRVTDRQTDGR